MNFKFLFFLLMTPLLITGQYIEPSKELWLAISKDDYAARSKFLSMLEHHKKIIINGRSVPINIYADCSTEPVFFEFKKGKLPEKESYTIQRNGEALIITVLEDSADYFDLRIPMNCNLEVESHGPISFWGISCSVDAAARIAIEAQEQEGASIKNIEKKSNFYHGGYSEYLKCNINSKKNNPIFIKLRSQDQITINAGKKLKKKVMKAVKKRLSL